MMKLKLSQKRSNKADGIHYLVPNMLQLHISQSSTSWNNRPRVSMKFLDQFELYFTYSLPTWAILMLKEGIVKCLRDSY